MKTVPGIRFYPSGSSLSPRRSYFDHIFEPLYPFWRDFVFVDDSGLIRIFDCNLNQEQEDALYRKLDSYIIQSDEDQYGNTRKLMTCSVFRDLGKYVYEFEGAGFCLLEPGVTLEHALRIEKAVWGQVLLEELPQGVICLLQNWDGVFWQIFSTDPGYLKTLHAAHGGSVALPAYWVELSEDFPNPRGSSPEAAGMIRVEPSAAPNGGPATRLGNSGGTEGPSSVS
jgi:hypothetical protein